MLCAPTMSAGKAMPYDPEKHHRRTIRLPEFDYRQVGAYFITVCVYQRDMLFGEIIDDEMILNEYGHIVLDEWMETAIIRPGIFLDEFIVMPNHFHAIIFLPDMVNTNDDVGAHSRAPSGGSVANAKISRFPRRRVQIHRNETDQCPSCNSRHACLAAQLL